MRYLKVATIVVFSLAISFHGAMLADHEMRLQQLVKVGPPRNVVKEVTLDRRSLTTKLVREIGDKWNLDGGERMGLAKIISETLEEK